MDNNNDVARVLLRRFVEVFDNDNEDAFDTAIADHPQQYGEVRARSLQHEHVPLIVEGEQFSYRNQVRLAGLHNHAEKRDLLQPFPCNLHSCKISPPQPRPPQPTKWEFDSGRVFAFFVLLVLLTFNAVVDGGSIFYYYTQWTFASITFYFGLGSILSINGCYKHHKKSSCDKVDHVDGDAEQGMYDVHVLPQSSYASNQDKNFKVSEVVLRQHASTWGYIFQIIFQVHLKIFIPQ
ncbi:unnamed protein product [Trifolium pratense]|uniref:Uncharacterized protein n=1 Tax=Trifolium pratense TaxID=57577 RepID=A0ACB0KWR4_TRIPR|nr:unnamed protein product [Trifolium pratense]